MSTGTALPGFRIVAAALRVTTERLAREVAQPQDEAPQWNDFEWDIARAVAGMQGISALLAHTLRWRGPGSWEAFLDEQRVEAAQRHEKIGQLLARIDSVTRRHAITVVALKGSALRELGLQRIPGERPMGDIDLLVRPQQLQALALALTTIGYEHSYTSRRHTVFRPVTGPPAGGFAERALNPVPIEVHTVIAEPLPFTAVDITERLWPTVTTSGINRYSSHGALLCHLLLHTAGNMRAHALRLSQLRDIAQLSTRMTGGDWNEFARATDPRAELWWMYPPLQLSARYFPGCIPSAALDAARQRCPTLLRRAAGHSALATVSWSNLHIDAFPGIEWSRSPLEALRFAKSRIFPNRETLDELKSAVNVLPGLGTIPWYGQRHAIRIVRWLFTRPPRVQTMRSVLDALATGHQAAEASTP